MANKELHDLLNVLVPLAVTNLFCDGVIRPFGATLNVNGEIVPNAEPVSRRRWPSDKDVEMLAEDFQEKSQSPKIVAIGICCEVFTKVRGSKTAVNAILCSLEHKNGDSINTYLPYRINIKSRAIEFGELCAKRKTRGFFAPKQVSPRLVQPS